MLGDLRRAQILADARERGGVSLRELSDRFDVSIPTIRRDLSALADQGLVQRVHGGAVVPRSERAVARVLAVPAGAVVVPTRRPKPEDGPLHVMRRVVAVAEAAALVLPGMAIGLSGGRPAVELAGLLDDVAGLTVVTPELAVAAAVTNRATVVVLVGGVRTPSGSHAGPLAEATLARLNLDLAVVELREGSASGDALAAQTDLTLVQRATAAVFLRAATGSRPRSG